MIRAASRVVRGVLLALLPLVLLLGLAELLFWATGLGTPARQLSLTRGFDREAHYLAPDPENEGGWRTQMFEVDYLERVIPPRSAKRRLVMVGGSNTQGFPVHELRRQLEEYDPEPGWEVINLGRSGYGSERVAIIAEQSLWLDPDVLLIYCGHNEFMELAFLEELEKAGALSWQGQAAEVLGQLRTMNVVTELLKAPLRDRSVDRTPDEFHKGRDERFRELSWDETTRFWEAYRQNLTVMVGTARDHDVPVVLCTLLGNDLEPPFVGTVIDGLPPVHEQHVRDRISEAMSKIPPRFRENLLPPIRLGQPDWGMTLRPEEVEGRFADPPAGERTVPTLRPLLSELSVTPATRPLAFRSVKGAHWRDPALWTSAVYDVLDTASLLHARQITDEEREQLVYARDLARDTLTEAPTYSLGWYTLALIEYLLGEDEPAVISFSQAFRYDHAPRRANELTNEIIREVAAQFPGVELLDVDRRMRKRTPGALVGYEMMTDVCHTQPGVRPVLMADFVGAVLVASKSD